MIVLTALAALIGVAAALYIAAPLLGDSRRPVIGLIAAAGVALGALGIYAADASPDQPGQPYSATVERLAAADPATLSLEEQEERLRAAVRRAPQDLEALALLGRLLARTGREMEAIAVLERALRVEEDPRVLSDLGQALVNLNEGDVTEPAERAFAAAYRLDPSLPEPAFFLGVAAYQDGDRDRAAQLWGEILSRLEPGDPFRQAIAARAADLLSRPGAGPGTGEGEAPFAGMEGTDPEAMVAAMIERLATRLQDDPRDFSGWLTLIRAQATAGDIEAALASYYAARARFDRDGREIILAALGRALGLQASPEPDTQSEEERG